MGVGPRAAIDPNFDVFNDSKIQSARDAPRSSCGARLCLLTIETLPLPQDTAPGRYSANVRILRISFRVIGAIARASVRHSCLARLARLHAAHHRTLFFAVLAPPVAVLRYRRFSLDLLLSDFALGPDKIIGAAGGRHQRLALDPASAPPARQRRPAAIRGRRAIDRFRRRTPSAAGSVFAADDEISLVRRQEGSARPSLR